jgi:hypothetical protein
MANWALVEDDKIKEVHDLLPKSWSNVSGLRLSSDNLNFLKSLGWYPVTKNHQDYDKSLYKENGTSHVFNGEQVVETLVLVQKEPEPETTFDQLKNNFMAELRNERNKKLLESDWTQLSDVLLNMNDDEKNNWKIYRQMLRNLPESYSNNNVVTLDQVEWPEFENYDSIKDNEQN